MGFGGVDVKYRAITASRHRHCCHGPHLMDWGLGQGKDGVKGSGLMSGQ